MNSLSPILLASDLTHHIHDCVVGCMVKNKKDVRFDEENIDIFYEHLLPLACQMVKEYVGEDDEKAQALQASIRYFFSESERAFRLFQQFVHAQPAVVAQRAQSLADAIERLKPLDDRLEIHKKDITHYKGVIQSEGTAMIALDLMADIGVRFVSDRVFGLATSLNEKPRLTRQPKASKV